MKTELIFPEDVLEFSGELRKLALGKRPMQKPTHKDCQRLYPACAALLVATRNQKPVKTEVDMSQCRATAPKAGGPSAPAQ